MADKNDPNCPKCDRPESASRWKAGRRLSICGNGHDWDTEAVKEQRAKSDKAKESEFKPFGSVIGSWKLRNS